MSGLFGGHGHGGEHGVGPGGPGAGSGARRVGERYRLDERLAVGGMGEVWRGTDELLSRQVAVKLLRPNLTLDDPLRRRFRTEARLAAMLRHEGIATLYDYGETSHSAYIVMELVDGEPLSTLIARHRTLGTDRTLGLMAQAARALQLAHEHGVVHRDVKPANIMVTPGGQVKITDFGIAQRADQEALTATGQVMGTAHYLAPEVAAGHPASALSDVYALGIVTYECLAGYRPFDGDNQVAVATAQLRQPPPPLPDTVSPPVASLIMRVLSKDPGRRPQSAEVLAAEFDRLRRRPRTGDTPVATEPATVPTRRAALGVTTALAAPASATGDAAAAGAAAAGAAGETAAAGAPGVPGAVPGARPRSERRAQAKVRGKRRRAAVASQRAGGEVGPPNGDPGAAGTGGLSDPTTADGGATAPLSTPAADLAGAAAVTDTPTAVLRRMPRPGGAATQAPPTRRTAAVTSPTAVAGRVAPTRAAGVAVATPSVWGDAAPPPGLEESSGGRWRGPMIVLLGIASLVLIAAVALDGLFGGEPAASRPVTPVVPPATTPLASPDPVVTTAAESTTTTTTTRAPRRTTPPTTTRRTRPTTTTTTPRRPPRTTSPSPGTVLVTIPPNAHYAEQVKDAVRVLSEQGFQVSVRWVASDGTQPENTVVDVQPSGALPFGSAVVVSAVQPREDG